MDLYNATVEIHRNNKISTIFRVYPDFPIRKFIPGQYGSLGLINDKGDRLIKRAYSISSSIIDLSTNKLQDQRRIKYLEFYINRVKEHNKREQITPKLFKLKTGDRLFCGEKIIGNYIYQDHKEWKNIFLISTHTGESPNNSIINKLLLDGKDINICNLNVGKIFSSIYSEEHKFLEKKINNYKFIQYEDNTENYLELTCYIEGFLNNDTSITKAIGFEFNKENTLIMLCGDPKMIGAPIKKGNWEYVYPQNGLMKLLQKGSLELTTRFKLGSIVYESYW